MNIIDKIAAYLSPTVGLKRMAAREHLKKLKARQTTYAAAKSDRMTGAWHPVNTSVNHVIGDSSVNVRARVRQLVRDFPYLHNAVNRIVDYTVGSGIMFQSKVRSPDDKLDKKSIRKVEDAFKFWADEADVAGKLHFYEMMALGKRQDVESGEFVLVKRFRPRENRYIPYCLQAYEADWLTTRNDTGMYHGPQPVEIYQGIEYRKSTGRVIAYHFDDPDSWGKPVRVKAENVIHGFQTLRPGQLRGISPFTSGLLLAHDLQDYMEAEIDAAKMAAKYLAFVKSSSPAGRQLGLETVTNDDGEQEYIEEMENAIIEYLNPDEDITIASNPRPGGTFPPMVRLLLCMLAATTGIPYEILSMDYQQLNYSTSRTSRNDFLHALKPVVARHIRQWCQPASVPFFDYAVLSGKLDLPGYFTNPHMYRRSEWQGPGMESIDPLRESKAWIDSTKSNLRSPQEAIRARGKDPEEVLREIQEFRAWEKEMGIEPMDVSKAMANNPASVEKQKSEKVVKFRRTT
jgi:lambda family phage portal protein